MGIEKLVHAVALVVIAVAVTFLERYLDQRVGTQ